MTKAQAIERLVNIQATMGFVSLEEKGWDTYVHALNGLKARTQFYPSWSRAKLLETLELAERASYVWEHVEDPRIADFVQGATDRSWMYDEHILDAYQALQQ